MNLRLTKTFIILLITFLSSCSPAEPITTATSALNTTTTPSPTSTMRSRAICPNPGNASDPVISSSINVSWVKQSISDYLNQGGDPETLINELTTSEYGNLEVKMDKADIDNDGINELIFSSEKLFPASNLNGADSGFWVFKCENNKYKIIYQIEIIDNYGGNPTLTTVVDLNQDNLKEIIIRSTWIGSGCLQYFDVISWEKDNPDPKNLVNNGEHFPCGTEVAIGRKDNNGNNQLLFEGESNIRYDSVAMIQRGFVDTYQLNDQIYTLKSHEYLPSPYRVYAIYDAQQALDKGDIHMALQFYDRAAHDETLQDVDSLVFGPGLRHVEEWPDDLSKQDHPKEYISAFSLFRLTVLNLKIHEEQKAMATLKELETNYPSGKFGAEFTEAALLFVEQHKSGNKPFESCQAVTTMIENKHPYLDWHFQWSTWTEFDYTNLTLCPYASDR